MSMPLIPVGDAIMPRPGGGRSVGAFVWPGNPDDWFAPGQDVMICPVSAHDGSLYSVGVTARVLSSQKQAVPGSSEGSAYFLLILLEGRSQARWSQFRAAPPFFATDDWEELDLTKMRTTYPTVSGAGWVPLGGYTEFRSAGDIPVTIYGNAVEDGGPVSIQGNLKGIVSMEQAHTIEHALIRALRTFGLCSARTLQVSMAAEVQELTWSVEKSMRFALPEVLGQTAAGACGNPMTQMARFYLYHEVNENLRKGQHFAEASLKARKTVMSKLTEDLGLTTDPSLRALQGLKKGMKHDASLLSLDECVEVLRRFPHNPWS